MRWDSAISSADLTDEILNDRVCGRHFVSGEAAKSWDKYNFDWETTLNVGHENKQDKSKLEQASQQGQRKREREKMQGKTRA